MASNRSPRPDGRRSDRLPRFPLRLGVHRDETGMDGLPEPSGVGVTSAQLLQGAELGADGSVLAGTRATPRPSRGADHRRSALHGGKVVGRGTVDPFQVVGAAHRASFVSRVLSPLGPGDREAVRGALLDVPQTQIEGHPPPGRHSESARAFRRPHARDTGRIAQRKNAMTRRCCGCSATSASPQRTEDRPRTHSSMGDGDHVDVAFDTGIDNGHRSSCVGPRPVALDTRRDARPIGHVVARIVTGNCFSRARIHSTTIRGRVIHFSVSGRCRSTAGGSPVVHPTVPRHRYRAG